MRFSFSRCAPAIGAALTLFAAACESPPTITGPGVAVDRVGSPRFATIPARGAGTTLDFGTYNVEWFGDPVNGPTNEPLQQSNVKDVLAGADIDIWGLEEVVSNTAFNNLEAALPGYTGFTANEALVVNGPQYYSDFSNTEQKVAILYKSSVATLLGAKIILTANDYDFAGRPPMEVKLRVNLNSATEDIVVIVLHMKCCTDNTSFTRRQNAGIALKAYLDATYPTQKVFVIGDWNDDTDTSITVGKPSPYKNFVDATATYKFETKALSDAHISSTTGYPDFIDHHLVTNESDATYVPNSAEAYRVDAYIPSYATTTTDHFPVLSRYSFGGPPPPPAPPVANFTAACTNLSCSFDASSSTAQAAATYAWAWGDATANGSGKTASHAYAAAGTYSVTLTVTDAYGTSSITKTVSPTNPPPVPAPVANFTTACSALRCTFTSTSTAQANATYVWVWGDATANGSGTKPVHTFPRAGTYQVKLTVTDAGGSSSITRAVTVTASCNGNC